MGRLTKVEDPGGATYTNYYQYNGLDDLTAVCQGATFSGSSCNAGGLGRIFEYTSLRRLKRATNPESGVIEYAYDALNRLTSKTYNDKPSNGASPATPSVTLCYDGNTTGSCGQAPAPGPGCYPKNRLTFVTSSVSTSRYLCFDALGRVTSSSQATAGAAYAFPSYFYKPAGLTSITYPSGRSITYSYDDAGRAVAVNGTKDNVPSTFAGISYAAHGQPGSIAMGNGVTQTIGWNGRLQMGSADHLRNGFSLMRLDYTYGGAANNGNVGNQTITAPGFSTYAQSYVYDAQNRLSNASESVSGWSQTYSYDQFGNRAVSGYIPYINGTPQSLSYTNNRWSSATYDAAGNQTGQDSRFFGYDPENRQTSASNFAGTGFYYYDGEGRRVQKTFGSTTTVYVYDGLGQLAAEYQNAGTVSGEGMNFLSQDGLGSTRLMTDSTGNVRRRSDYFPFGEEISSGLRGGSAQYTTAAYPSVVPDLLSPKFTSKERDAETGLDFFGARYYSGAQGRFTSPDWSATPQPIPYADLSDPQTLNLYSYVRNNPLSRTDPDGHCCWDYLVGFAKGTANRALDNISDLAKNGDPIQRVVNGAVQTDLRFSANGGDQQSAMQVGYQHGDTTIGLAVAVVGAKGGKSEALPNEAVVVRGGTNTPEAFAKGSGVTIDASGKLQGVSVQAAPGKSAAELSQGIPHNKVGVTTVGDVRAAGGEVTPSGTTGNPNHCTMCGVTPPKASELMRVIPNPAKKPNE